MLLTQTSQTEYEELCKLDVSGLRDPRDQSQTVVFEEFNERLTCSPEGWYETTLPWKANHPPLPSNKDGSLKRLHSLNRKLQREGLTEEYGAIIKEQLDEGVIEKAPPVSQSKEFYIPHKSVVRKTAETTKMRIVYDASARATPDSPSLNDCLHPEPALQNRLLRGNARLAKKDLTTSRLELVSAHMAANLVTNVRNALKGLPEPTVYGWLDSTVALHWILGNGQYRQFVANRVCKIREHPEIRWRYVSTSDNPADLASRGGEVTNAELWCNGPVWLSDPEKWPDNPVTAKSPASEEEAKTIKEVLNLAQQQHNQDRNEFDELLERNNLRRVLRAHAWVIRFTTRRERRGPLTSQDTLEVKEWWIKRVQTQDMQKPKFEQTKQMLNLVPNKDGVLECHGLIQGKHPVYIPADATFTRKLVQRIHAETLHGGVSLTMAAIPRSTGSRRWGS